MVASERCRRAQLALAAHVGVAGVGQQHLGHLGGPQDVVGVAAVDQVPRHRRELCAFRVLRDAQPADRLDRLRPAVPLDPIPLMMMAIARSRCSWARLLKKSSTGRLAVRGPSSGGPRCSRPSAIVSTCPGRIT